MRNLRPFELALIGIFGAFAVGGLIFLAMYKAKNTDDNLYGTDIQVWGTLERNATAGVLQTLSESNKSLSVVHYTEVKPKEFRDKLLTAIAEGRSPDLIIISQGELVPFRSILSPLSNEQYPIGEFKTAYIDGAEIFARPDGIYALPFAVDPLVMYWNRDMFSTAGLPNPPATWGALVSRALPVIVKKNPQLELSQSAIAFGEYVNISHAKKILSMLLLQAGSNIIEEERASYYVTIERSVRGGMPAGQAAFSFFTQFASPQNAYYSWNRAQEMDRVKFLGGTLALYFAPGSEYEELLRDNPNLNFAMAQVPQEDRATAYRNYGDFYAFAVPRSSRHYAEALGVAYLLSNAETSRMFADALKFAPVHRSTIENGTNDPIGQILYPSALISRTWLDPSPSESGDVLRTAIENITSGRKRVADAVSDVVKGIQILFK